MGFIEARIFHAFLPLLILQECRDIRWHGALSFLPEQDKVFLLLKRFADMR